MLKSANNRGPRIIETTFITIYIASSVKGMKYTGQNNNRGPQIIEALQFQLSKLKPKYDFCQNRLKITFLRANISKSKGIP